MHSRIGRTLAVSLVAFAPAAAQAGSPLLCFPMAIGDGPLARLGLRRAAGTRRAPTTTARGSPTDTLALLGPQTPVLVRMETLRRAVIYASGDAAAARNLFDALRGRAGRASGGKAEPLAQFDLGYAVEAYRQTRHRARPPGCPAGPPEDGYALVRQALAARGPDPRDGVRGGAHHLRPLTAGASPTGTWRLALAGARAGSDLARTLAAHQPAVGRPPRGLAGRGLALKPGRLPARVDERAEPLVVDRLTAAIVAGASGGRSAAAALSRAC